MQVISLILSDVIDDPLELIASGPTVADITTAKQCLGYFKKLRVQDDIPNSVMQLLERKTYDDTRNGGFSVTNEAKSLPTFDHVQNVVVGSNSIALAKCAVMASDLGYVVHNMTRSLCGEARQAGIMFARLARYISLLHGYKSTHQTTNRDLVAAEMDLIRCQLSKESISAIVQITNQASNLGYPICVICSGETTVDVRGKGKGGRNQELTLAMAMELHKITEGTSVRELYDIQFLSAGTDGQDAETDAAGAYCDGESIQCALEQHLSPNEHLENNDSYSFFRLLKNGQDHFKTGITGTNVMDIQILLIRPMRMASQPKV